MDLLCKISQYIIPLFVLYTYDLKHYRELSYYCPTRFILTNMMKIIKEQKASLFCVKLYWMYI